MRFDSNPLIDDQDVNPLVEDLKDSSHHRLRNERTDKHFDLEIEEEDHKSIDSFNFGDGKKPLFEPRVHEFIHADAYEDEDYFYRFGVIDFLQAYTRKKKLETILLRKRFNKKPRNCFSCVEPPIYADRFYEFLVQNLFTD